MLQSSYGGRGCLPGHLCQKLGDCAGEAVVVEKKFLQLFDHAQLDWDFPRNFIMAQVEHFKMDNLAEFDGGFVQLSYIRARAA